MSDVPVPKDVLPPVPPVPATVSVRAYAKHRGVSHTAVLRAIDSGRLKDSVLRSVLGKTIGITDLELADREWAASTDLTKAPTAVIAHTEQLEQATAGARSTEDPDSPESAPAPTGDDARLSLSDATAREKHWKAKSAELEYKKRIGELVDAKEVEARMVEEYSRCRTKLLGMARKAKAEMPELTHAQVLKIDTLVREALEGLAGSPLTAPQPEAQPES